MRLEDSEGARLIVVEAGARIHMLEPLDRVTVAAWLGLGLGFGFGSGLGLR